MALSGNFSSSYRGWKYQIEWSAAQSIDNNNSTITCVHKLVCEPSFSLYIGSRSNSCTVDGVKVAFTSPDISTEGGTTITLGTTKHTVAHNADGTKSCTVTGYFYLQATLSGTYKEYLSASSTITLDTIPRASSLTAANGTLGTQQTLTINRATSNFMHRLLYRCGNSSGYIAGSASDFTTLTSLNWTPPISLAQENKAGTSVSITLTLHTYTGLGVHIGTTTKTITCAIPASVKPSVTIAWQDLSGAAGTYGSPVQGISKLKINLTEQTSYGSPITSRTITANGAKYNTTEATTEALTAAGSQSINATIKDERGRSGSANVTLNVLAYEGPVISKLTVHRCDADGTENDQGEYIQVTFSAAITSLNSKNSAAYKLRYKASNATSYTEIALTALANNYTVTNHAHLFAADGNNSYDVEIVATDNHGTATRTTSASTAFTMLNWNAKGNGMGVGKVSERENAVEFALKMFDQFDTQISNGLAVYTGSGDNAIDANTTLDHLVLTTKNTPSTAFWYVMTLFYSTKSETSNRTQFALPYSTDGSLWVRRYYNGAWSAWTESPTVVAAGTSGLWTYVKWSDGRVELSGSHWLFGMACTTALGGWFRTDVIQPEAFPFPVYDQNLLANYESDGYGAVLWATTLTTTTKPANYYLIRPTSTTIASGKIAMRVTGRWK